MNDSSTYDSGKHRGPSLTAVGATYAALFVASLVAAALLAPGAHFPRPYEPEAAMAAYFAAHADAARVSAFFQLGSAVPFGIFAAAAASRLRFLGVRAAGPTIALFGGAGAASMLALSALAQWSLCELGAGAATGVVRALDLFAFATGGPGFVVLSGLMVAGISVAAGLHRLAPRWVMVFGLVIAAVAELSSLSLVSRPLALLLPAARFPTFVWIVCAGALIAKSRARHENGEVHS